jgi:hypothetical protein
MVLKAEGVSGASSGTVQWLQPCDDLWGREKSNEPFKCSSTQRKRKMEGIARTWSSICMLLKTYTVHCLSTPGPQFSGCHLAKQQTRFYLLACGTTKRVAMALPHKVLSSEARAAEPHPWKTAGRAVGDIRCNLDILSERQPHRGNCRGECHSGNLPDTAQRSDRSPGSCAELQSHWGL